jgi:O-antigen/teichoic acid export membrane protein
MGILKTVLSPLVTLPLLLMGFRSVAMVSTSLLISLITDVIYLIYAKQVLRVSFSLRHAENGLFFQLLGFTSFIALNLIVDQVNNNMGKFLLGRFCGTEIVAVYALGYTLYQYYIMFSTSVSGVFSPRVHRIVSESMDDHMAQRKQLTELFIKVGRVQFLILGLVASGVVFFGKQFIFFWAGEGYEESYTVATVLIMSVTVPLVQNLGIEIQRAQNKHWFRSLVYFIMACLNFMIMIYLCPKYGATGAVIGTAVSYLLANGLVMNIYYHYHCNLDIIAFWRELSKLIAAMIGPCVVGLAISKLWKMDSLLKLAFGIMGYTAIYCVCMWLFGMNGNEKSLVTVPLRKVFKRWFD